MFDGNELHSICCRAKTLMFVPWEARPTASLLLDREHSETLPSISVTKANVRRLGITTKMHDWTNKGLAIKFANCFEKLFRANRKCKISVLLFLICHCSYWAIGKKKPVVGTLTIKFHVGW